jgi:hypothetical protein
VEFAVVFGAPERGTFAGEAVFPLIGGGLVLPQSSTVTAAVPALIAGHGALLLASERSTVANELIEPLGSPLDAAIACKRFRRCSSELMGI